MEDGDYVYISTLGSLYYWGICDGKSSVRALIAALVFLSSPVESLHFSSFFLQDLYQCVFFFFFFDYIRRGGIRLVGRGLRYTDTSVVDGEDTR